MNFYEQLMQINLALQAAADALDDEHEGNFKYQVDRLDMLTTELKCIVDKM